MTRRVALLIVLAVLWVGGDSTAATTHPVIWTVRRILRPRVIRTTGEVDF